MDLKEIRQIIEMMKRHDLSLFHLERDGMKIKLKKGMDYEARYVHLLRQGGEQLQPEYKRMNPLGRVPTLIDGKVVLTQSLAIMEYLEEAYPAPPIMPMTEPNSPPKPPPDCAEFDAPPPIMPMTWPSKSPEPPPEPPAPAASLNLFVPPGHFYSPLPSIEDIRRNEARLFAPPPRELPGIALNEAGQLALLAEFQSYYDAQPFTPERSPGLRYFFENPAYSYSDAIFLHCMIRHVRPRRIIEVGSGYSSCVTLDTNERHFDNSIACTFIEPYPELLRSLVRPDDLPRIEILERGLQDVELSRFRALEANDILFIDSTHVAKIGSDVNYIFAQILPALQPGVYVHFHDIFYPFEYPKAWVLEGRGWTEDYMLRAFLTYNVSFEIKLFNTFLERFHREWFALHMPVCLRNEGGSIWLRRV